MHVDFSISAPDFSISAPVFYISAPDLSISAPDFSLVLQFSTLVLWFSTIRTIPVVFVFTYVRGYFSFLISNVAWAVIYPICSFCLM